VFYSVLLINESLHSDIITLILMSTWLPSINLFVYKHCIALVMIHWITLNFHCFVPIEIVYVNIIRFWKHVFNAFLIEAHCICGIQDGRTCWWELCLAQPHPILHSPLLLAVWALSKNGLVQLMIQHLKNSYMIRKPHDSVRVILYETKFWREKILANLFNLPKFSRPIKKLILKN